MRINKIQELSFRESQQNTSQKREFIDVLTDAVKNPRDVNDCVAVPRGIFKAYLLIMTGSAILALSNLIKGYRNFSKHLKKLMVITGWTLNTLSALFFAKPFAFKGNSPTVTKEEVNKNNS